jgi:hypothetical protein
MKLFLLSLIAPLGLVAAGAAGAGIAGAWDCIATDARGNHTQWGLVIKQDGDKLSATLRGDDGHTLDLLDPRLEDGHFSFHFKINPTEAVEVVLKVNGDRMDGRFGGTTAGAGLFKAARAGALDVTGKWSGEWVVGPDGGPGPHYMVLQQDTGKVTGTAGPGEERQLEFANGKLAGGHLTFDISLAPGIRLAFDFTVAGNTMSGAALFTMSGVERKLTLAVKRIGR